MKRQTDAEAVVPSDPASRIRWGAASPLDAHTAGEFIRQSLGQVSAVSITQLALASPGRPAGDLADRFGHRLASVSPDTDQGEGHHLMSRYSMSIISVGDVNPRVQVLQPPIC